MAELLFLRDDELQMRTPVRGDRVVIGRSPEADFIVPDKAVSRRQCALERRGDSYALVDLSGRGTRVGSRTAGVGGTVLRDGDEIRLGAFSLVFGDGPEPTVEADKTGRSRRGKTAHKDGATSSGRARILIRRAEGELAIPLKAEEGWKLTIGSDPRGRTVVELRDRFASADHARLTFKDGRWVLRDLDSRNGTFLDGVRIIEALPGPRAFLRIGESSLVFETEAAGFGATHEPLPGLFTADSAMQPLVEQVRRVAPSRIAVAVHGETGSGKEMVARAIHLLSERRDKPFVALNCGALAKDLIESELFGHEKGAFTGADKTRAGAFEEADGGTLFLDEIGDLPLPVQVKLLRTLERGEIRRLGGTRTLTVDVRIVSATHHDLLAAVEQGTFREDLFYRLCVAPLEVPPLRQRPEDIVLLAQQFARQLAPPGVEVGFSAAAEAKLRSYAWPGNARELRNSVQLALLQRTGQLIDADHLVLRDAGKKAVPVIASRLVGRSIEELEREALRVALLRHGSDKQSAWEELGISRATFFRKLALYDLESPA
jgi:transcriptional regulator with AAA-type ATPase domain